MTRHDSGSGPQSRPLVDKTISSQQNPLLNEWRDCLTPKGIKKHGHFLISGERAVSETLERFPQLAHNLLVCAERHSVDANGSSSHGGGSQSIGAKIARMNWRSFFHHAKELTTKNDPRFSIVALAPKIFDELDVAGTHYPILVARTPVIEEADLSKPPVGLEILCALGDPSNVGALLRSVTAFGATKVILLKESATPFHPKAVRAASAATLSMPLAKGPSIKDIPQLAEASGSECPYLALDMNGESIDTFNWPKGVRLLLGEEGQGVPNSKAFRYISIPMMKGVESLNATVAASVALYSYRLHASRN